MDIALLECCVGKGLGVEVLQVRLLDVHPSLEVVDAFRDVSGAYEEKNRLNQKKHRISFEMAALAFEDECCLVRPDRVDETGEQRWYAIGAARLSPDASVVLFVVHVYREEIDGEEIIRIISARRADKDDFRRYQEQEMD